MCGTEQMHPGDKCGTTKYSEATANDYMEQKSANTGGAWAVILVGMAPTVGGILWLRASITGKRHGDEDEPGPTHEPKAQ